jgi:drug/metabolite transporter (DMT)-like permease
VTDAAARPMPAAVAAAAASIQVGAAIVATRAVIGETDPTSLALWRYLIGVACLLPFLIGAPRPRFAQHDLLPMAVLGIVQFGLLIVLLNDALRFVPSGRVSLLFATFPMWTLIFAALLGRERLTMPKTVGVALTIVGVALALGEHAIAPGAAGTWASTWRGELTVLASALCGAICSVLYRPYLRKYPALPVSIYAMLAAIVFLAVIAAPQGFFTTAPRFSLGGWSAVLFIGIGSGIGYFLWLWALNHTTPTRVTVFLALSPLTATVLGTALLGEIISGAFLFGLACVAAGLWLANRELAPAAAAGHIGKS